MLKFPGQDTTQIIKNEKVLYFEPFPQIGNSITCSIIKLTPTQAFAAITHIEGVKTSIKYKAIIRPQDVGVNLIENQFVWDKIEKNKIYNARIISFGDTNGIFISPIFDK